MNVFSYLHMSLQFWTVDFWSHRGRNTIFVMFESTNPAVLQKRYKENCKHRRADVHVGVNPQPGVNNMASNQPKLSTVFLFINRVVSESCNI